MLSDFKKCSWESAPHLTREPSIPMDIGMLVASGSRRRNLAGSTTIPSRWGSQRWL